MTWIMRPGWGKECSFDTLSIQQVFLFMKQPIFNEKTFWNMPLVVIMRGFPLDSVAPVVEAIARGGLNMLEITMNTDGAVEQIQ